MTEINKQRWGTTASGEEVELYILRNARDMEAAITNYGGRLVRLKALDRNGRPDDVVLGFDTLDGYLQKNPFFGALVGRYANRIANAEFKLDGKTYHLPRNSGDNSIHGGIKGFDKVVWRGRPVETTDGPALQLIYTSKDGEEGYPGTLTATVVYSMKDSGELHIDYLATTDQTTVLNLTNHSYFDLSGQGHGNIVNHVVKLNADRFTPVNEHLIPTGELRSVDNTPFDFRKPTRIGERIDDKDQQMLYGQGYDHNYVLNGNRRVPSLAVRISDPQSGRVMEVLTTQPGVQFYTGNHLDGSVRGKGGVAYGFRSGVCFETQHFPDSPNHPEFPSTELSPGNRYQETTIFRFSTE
jgi:aldose 1-epimerase